MITDERKALYRQFAHANRKLFQSVAVHHFPLRGRGAVVVPVSAFLDASGNPKPFATSEIGYAPKAELKAFVGCSLPPGIDTYRPECDVFVVLLDGTTIAAAYVFGLIDAAAGSA